MSLPLHQIADYETGRQWLGEMTKAGTRKVRIKSPDGAAGQMGPLTWKALVGALRRDFPEIEIEDWIDCAEDAGYALAALRAGCSGVIFAGPRATAEQLSGIAGQLGARLLRRRDAR
jgi:hypothetical protein